MLVHTKNDDKVINFREEVGLAPSQSTADCNLNTWSIVVHSCTCDIST